jgi:hypothetical protein
MQRILYIDLICQFGHVNINKNIINRFIELGLSVDIVFRKGYAERLNIPLDLVKWEVPESWFYDADDSVRERYFQYKALREIKHKFPLRDYDYIFMSSFEEISLFFSGFKGNLLLLNHGNVAGLDNRIKRFFLKRISRYSTIIVFFENIKKRFIESGITKVMVEPHGFPHPYNKSDVEIQWLLNSMDPRLTSSEFKFKIFAPTGSKYNDNFISTLLQKQEFLNFLSSQNLLFILKDKPINVNHKNIIALPDYVADEEYQSIFLNADCILIHYPPSFIYRVSAVLHECFANQKPCLLSDIESFDVFNPHFTYPAFYKNTDELISRINNLIDNRNVLNSPYVNLDSLKISYESLLKINSEKLTSY